MSVRPAPWSVLRGSPPCDCFRCASGQTAVSSIARPVSLAVAVGPVACALTYLIIPCSGIYFYGNTITSFAGTTFDCKYCEWVPLPHRVPPTADHLMLLLCIPASCASSVSGSVAAALTCRCCVAGTWTLTIIRSYRSPARHLQGRSSKSPSPTAIETNIAPRQPPLPQGWAHVI